MTSFPLMLMAACLLMTSEPGRCYEYRSVACEGYEARLNCDEGQVISVLRANYGRHDRTTCSSGQWTSSIWNVNCSQPTERVAERCDGKSCCTITASNSEFGDPCRKTYKYLDVTYTCKALTRRPNEAYSVICEDSAVHLKCGRGYVLNIHRADYGRHDRTTCSSTQSASKTQNDCCSQPTGKVAESCNGKRSCYITASNSVFGDTCRGTYKYLDVTYTCDSI